LSRLGSRSKIGLLTFAFPIMIAAAFPSTLVFAAPSQGWTKKPKSYRPKFFKPHEFKTLKLLTETILRDDEMPGVREAKSNEFIDFQITYDPEIQDRFREGLVWLDRHSRKLHGKTFIGLTPAQRKDIIQSLEIKALHRPGEEQGREFYELARRYTYMGFYASEEALRIAIPETAKPPKSLKRHRLAGANEDKNSPSK
jgi:hypothetical protein